MRLSPQSMRVVALLSVGLGAVVAACSSSSSEEVLAADAGSDTSSSGLDSGSTTDTGGSNFDSATNTETSVFDAGPQYDAGAPVTLDGGGPDGGGLPCVQGGIAEVEPNNAAGTATPFTTSVCGFIEPNSAPADAAADASVGAEVDFLTFTLQAATTSFFVQFSGDVTLNITVDGQTVVLTPTSFPPIPFVKNKPYVIEVKANQASTTVYRVSLFES